MPIDSSIPLQSNAPDPMVSLNSMLDMGVKSLSLAKNRATFDADVARSKAESSTAESGAEVNRANIQQKIREQAAQTSSAQSKASVDAQSIAGNVRRTNADASTAEAGAAVAGGTIGSRIDQSTAAASTATTGAGSAAVDLNTKKTVNAIQALQSVMANDNYNATGDQPYDVVKGHADALSLISYLRKTKQDSGKIDILEPEVLKAAETKGAMAALIKGYLMRGMSPEGAAKTLNPENQYVNDSAVITPTPSNGMYSGFRGADTQQPRVVQLPPTTPTVGGTNGITPGVKGPAPTPGATGPGSYNEANQAGQAAANDVASQIFDRQTERKQQAAQGNVGTVAAIDREIARLRGTGNTAGNPAPATSGFFQTGLPQGQEANLKDNTEAMNTHFSKLSVAAENAPLALSLVSSIKSLANGAITGTLQGRTAYINGMLNSVHLGDKISGDLQKDTDLLEKYMSQLNLTTPAATNAMREIITAGRPHGTMIKGALIDAAEQFGSVVAANLAQRDHLASYKFANGGKGDAVGYDTEKRNIESIADPKIFQMQGKSRDEIQAFMAKLPLDEQQALKTKSRLLHQMGITK